MNSFFSCQFHLDEGNQLQSHIPFLSLESKSTNYTSPYPFFLHNQQDHVKPNHGDLPHHYSQPEAKYVREEDQQHEPSRWMSSKMRIMRKMMNSDQTSKTKTRRTNHQYQDHKQVNQESVIRVCKDCSTTKTPLWRSGPHGPKSLCNACGIRQRKARRAMADSAMKSEILAKEGKDKISDFAEKIVPFKKRCKFSAPPANSESAQRKICFENIVLSLNKSSANLHRLFPQDEKDAAILLMALSCGLL